MTSTEQNNTLNFIKFTQLLLQEKVWRPVQLCGEFVCEYWGLKPSGGIYINSPSRTPLGPNTVGPSKDR